MRLSERVRLLLGDREIDLSTVVESRPGSLKFRTIVPEVDTEVHSSFVAHSGSVSAAHLIVSERLGARPVAESMSGDLGSQPERGPYLLEHLSYVRDAVAEELGGNIRLEVDR
jgi:hypothetical protein